MSKVIRALIAFGIPAFDIPAFDIPAFEVSANWPRPQCAALVITPQAMRAPPANIPAKPPG